VVIGGLILGAIKVYDLFFKDAEGTSNKKASVKKEELQFHYTLKLSFLTHSEKAFYTELQRTLGSKYIIFSKVRIPDFINIGVDKYRDRTSWLLHWNKIKSKHVDFLLCNPATLMPEVAIEVNGKSHETEKMIKRDAFVGGVYKSAGIKFVTIKVGESFAEKVQSLL